MIVQKAELVKTKGSYAVLMTNGEIQQTGVERASLEPVWHDEFHFYGELHEFVRSEEAEALAAAAAAAAAAGAAHGSVAIEPSTSVAIPSARRGSAVTGVSPASEASTAARSPTALIGCEASTLGSPMIEPSVSCPPKKVPKRKKDVDVDKPGLTLRVLDTKSRVIGSCHVSLRELAAPEYYHKYDVPLSHGGRIKFSVKYNATTRGIQETKQEIKVLKDNLDSAADGLKLPGRILLEGVKRSSKQHFTNWVEERVARGLEGIYTRTVKYMHDKSEMPSCIAATAVAVFDRMWVEVREPVTLYLKEEFSRAIGAASEIPVEDELTEDSAAVKPPASHLCWWVVYWVRKLRIWWVRTLYPHDLSLWRTVKNPWYCILLFLACFPYYGISPMFYVITFFFIERADTFQLCQIIVQFKGLMAFTTGIVGLMSGGLRASIAEDALIGCVNAGAPGGIEGCDLGPIGWPGGWATFWWDMTWWFIQVLTVWASFLLLPYSNDTAIGLVYECAQRAASMESQYSLNLDDEFDDTDPHGPSPTKLFERWDEAEAKEWYKNRNQRRGSLCVRARNMQNRRKTYDATIRKMSKTNVGAAGLPGQIASPPPSPPTAIAPMQSPQSVHSPEISLPPRRATGTPTSPLEWARASRKRLRPSMQDSRGIDKRAEAGGKCCLADGEPCCAGAALARQRCCSAVGGLCEPATKCFNRCQPVGCLFICGERVRYNRRRGGLLRRWFEYELSISAFCGVIAAAQALRMLYRVAPEALLSGNLFHAYSQLTKLEDMQFRAALFWVRVIYGLLSLPFFVFMLPYFFEALTRSRPTAYDENGNCVRILTRSERQEKARRQGVQAVALASKERMAKKERAETVRHLSEKFSPRSVCAADLEQAQGAVLRRREQSEPLALV